MKLPENFDQPYLSRNVIDYWTRFHRTLGFWIRDYLFLPLYKGVAERWPERADSLAFLCYFVAFFVAGIWHGPTANFVVLWIVCRRSEYQQPNYGSDICSSGAVGQD